jgi:SOS response associated peptidase (SRAP)
MSESIAEGSAGGGAGSGAAVSLLAGSTGPAAAAGRTIAINEATAMTSHRCRSRGRVQDVRLRPMDGEYTGSRWGRRLRARGTAEVLDDQRHDREARCGAGVARAVQARSQRCVMPEAGFYEWQFQPDGTKQPYYIQPAGDNEVLDCRVLGPLQNGVR